MNIISVVFQGNVQCHHLTPINFPDPALEKLGFQNSNVSHGVDRQSYTREGTRLFVRHGVDLLVHSFGQKKRKQQKVY